jgi:hypothetical protein
MATKAKKKPKIEILGPENLPVSYDQDELRKVIRELAEARRRKKRKQTPHGAK